MTPEAHRIAAADGLTLQLLEWSGAGPPLLFLHGFGMSAHVWAPFAAELAAHFRVLALDARGHGGSGRDPESRYSHAAVTRDLAAVVDGLSLERFALVGHSMGAYAAIRYSARHAARVDRLVLVDAGPELRVRQRPPQAPKRLPPKTGFASEAAYARALGEMFPRARPETLADLAHHWLRRRDDGRFEPRLDPAFLRPRSPGDASGERVLDRAQWAREETERLWRYLADLACPTLVVRGAESDILSAATLERMVRETLRDGRAVTLAGSGHAVMLDAPEAFLAALREFLLD